MEDAMKKTYRVKLELDDKKATIYRTDGIATYCCSMQRDFFCWQRNTKYNDYNGWSGYVSASILKSTLKHYNPDNLTID